ncbi:MAG: hypothetical protein RLZZ579_1198 [Actinomycetota bacterium]
MKLELPRLDFRLIDSAPVFADLIQSISETTGPLGIDAERASGFRYSQKAYLIQICDGATNWLIDPIGINERGLWEDLQEVISKRLWILHAATQDLPCLAELGLFPSQVFDTEVAAKLLGLEKVGLGSLALAVLDLELAKEHSASDWSIRPISREMLVYAALDVDILFDLERALSQRLVELGRTSWMQQEMDFLVTFKPKPQKIQPWRSLPGVSKFRDPAQVQIAASLWLARDQIAREQDIAPGRLIPDRSISLAATSKPKSKSELAKNKEFHGRASRTMLDVWWNAIDKSSSIDVSEKLDQDPNFIPNHRSWEKRFPDAHARLERVRPRILQLASELSIPQENLLSPDSLRRLCFAPEDDIRSQLQALRVRPWQIEIVLDAIIESLREPDLTADPVKTLHEEP